MGKKDFYIIEKNVNKIIRGDSTNFLDPSTLKNVCGKLKGYNYNIYYPYNESDKVIIYTNDIPKIRLLEIISYDKLTHREIMGSLYGLNIDSEMFGDIIIWNNHYYIMVMDSIYDLVINDLDMIGNHHIKIKEVDINILDNYERKYEKLEFIVSSLRIDTVICRLIGTSRDNIKKKFYDNEVILNYEICHKITYNLNDGDIFSIRRYGKYKFGGVVKKSKKDNYIIKIYKYIDN